MSLNSKEQYWQDVILGVIPISKDELKHLVSIGANLNQVDMSEIEAEGNIHQVLRELNVPVELLSRPRDAKSTVPQDNWGSTSPTSCTEALMDL